MEKEINLVDAIKNKNYVVVCISESLGSKIAKRLGELGIVKHAVVSLVHLSKFARGGIVRVMESNVCLDTKILSNVRVREA
ncbi:MAG: ferrous iron transport protein A [Clostridia bacterium]|nr:ferrous iron transport protein A [Clostridia bacterium]